MSDVRIVVKDDDGKTQEYTSIAGAVLSIAMMLYESSIEDVEIHIQTGMTDYDSVRVEFSEFIDILFRQCIPFRVRFTQ